VERGERGWANTLSMFIFNNIPGSFASFQLRSFVFIDIPGSFPSFFKFIVVGAQVGNDLLSLPIDNGPLLRKVRSATAGFLFISS
jgi:hypothetical protein